MKNSQILIISLVILFLIGGVIAVIYFVPSNSQSAISSECSRYATIEDLIPPGAEKTITAGANEEVLWRTSKGNPFASCGLIDDKNQCNSEFNCEWSGVIGFRSCKSIPDARPGASECSSVDFEPLSSGVLKRGKSHSFTVSDNVCALLYEERYRCTDPCGNEPDGSSCSRDCECSSNECLAGQCITPITSECGDNICELDETRQNCPQDCDGNGGSVCGNLICESDETVSSCSTDCLPGKKQCWELLPSGTTCQTKNIASYESCGLKGYYSSLDDCVAQSLDCPDGYVVENLVCVKADECSSCLSWGLAKISNNPQKECSEATVWEVDSWLGRAFNIEITQSQWCPFMLISTGSIVLIALVIAGSIVLIAISYSRRGKKKK